MEESAMNDSHPANAAPLAPLPLPRMQPMAMELLDIVAKLMVDVDSYRVMLGLPAFGPRREFTKADMAEGRALGPLAMVVNEESVVVRLEN
jgi:hypothetical protein